MVMCWLLCGLIIIEWMFGVLYLLLFYLVCLG